jgi:hypothetical protein
MTSTGNGQVLLSREAERSVPGAGAGAAQVQQGQLKDRIKPERAGTALTCYTLLQLNLCITRFLYKPMHDWSLLHCAASFQLYTFTLCPSSHRLALLLLRSAFGISFQVIHVVDNKGHAQSNRSKSVSYDYGDLSKRSNAAETSTFANIIESTERRTHIRISDPPSAIERTSS